MKHDTDRGASAQAFVLAGLVDRQTSRDVARLSKGRVAADYGPGVEVHREDALQALERAEWFLAQTAPLRRTNPPA